jgi:predicted nucleic acid-binding protein
MGEFLARRCRACAACAPVMAWLLDTNVLAELPRPRPDLNVVAFVAGQQMISLFASVASLAEVRFGIELIVESAYRAQLNH